MERRDRIERAAWMWLFSLPLLFYIGWNIGQGVHRAVRGPLPSELGVGRGQELGPAGPQEGTLSSSLTSERTAADAHLTPAEEEANSGEYLSSPVPAPAGASAGVLPRDLAPGMLPTAEGLYASTVELWSQAEFLLDIHATHLDLPTYDDCLAAVKDPCAMSLLKRSQALQISLGVLGQVPDARRGEAFQRSLETTERMAVDAERNLMRRLDCLGYPRWTEMSEKYAEWSQP